MPLAHAQRRAASSVGPSTPQFRLRLCVGCRRGCPRRSPRCACARSSTRSCRVKPSWQVTKLMLACGRAAARLVQIAAAGEPRRELADLAGVAAPEPAHRVAVPAVPLGPPTGSCRPDSRPSPRSHGSAISLTWETTGSWRTTSKNAPSGSTSCSSPAERRGEVEAEAVDVHLAHPVAQAVHHQLQRPRVRAC